MPSSMIPPPPASPAPGPNQQADTAQPALPQCVRFFFAIRPDEATTLRIDAFAAAQVPDGRRLKLDHQHVTLALTADFKAYPDAIVAQLLLAGGEVKAEAFDLTLDRLSANRRSRTGDSAALRTTTRHRRSHGPV